VVVSPEANHLNHKETNPARVMPAVSLPLKAERNTRLKVAREQRRVKRLLNSDHLAKLMEMKTLKRSTLEKRSNRS